MFALAHTPFSLYATTRAAGEAVIDAVASVQPHSLPDSLCRGGRSTRGRAAWAGPIGGVTR